MTTLRLILDDSQRAPPDVAALAGITRFGRLLYRRRELSRRVVEAAEAAGIDQIIHVTTTQDLDALRTRASERHEPGFYLYFPANLVTQAPDDRLTDLLTRLRYVDRAVRLEVNPSAPWTGLVMLRAEPFASFLDAVLDGTTAQFMTARADDIAPIDNKLGFVDLRDYAAFVEFLTSNFEVRHFNSVRPVDAYTLIKTSTDRTKIRAEFDYLTSLPDSLGRYFIRPYGYTEDAHSASYRMERVLIPDMALQWIHGSLSEDEFARFLAHVFDYVARRPTRPATVDVGRRVADGLYLDKLEARMRQLEGQPVFAQLDALVSSHGLHGGLWKLVERFRHLYAAMAGRRTYDSLVLGHGDLCFSNILYDKSTRSLKLIDPRGVATGDDAYTDPYYDVAKLSHSILGLYDYVNNGLFGIEIDGDLTVRLQCDLAGRAHEQARFRGVLMEQGFDPVLARLYEASLFLSMLPLHSELPRKQAAFALTAAAILDELESARPGDRSP